MKQKWLLRWARWLVVAVLLVFLVAVAVISFAKVWAGEVQYLPFLIGAAISPVVLIGRFWRQISTPLKNRGKAAYERGDYEQCRRLCQRLYKKDPTDVRNLCAWGKSLVFLATKQQGDQADALFAEAQSKFQQAIELQPDFAEGWFGWGWSLHWQATKTEGQIADALFDQAGKKYQQTLNLLPDYAYGWFAWGRALTQYAKGKTNEPREALLRQAEGKFQQAATIQPDDAKAWYEWGRILALQSDLKQDTARQELLQQAEVKFLQAHQLHRGMSAFCLACICALRGDEQTCRQWLEMGQRGNTLFPREYAMNNKNLASMRDKDWFQAIRWKGE